MTFIKSSTTAPQRHDTMKHSIDSIPITITIAFFSVSNKVLRAECSKYDNLLRLAR
jgi:hypothetical protein